MIVVDDTMYMPTTICWDLIPTENRPPPYVLNKTFISIDKIIFK